MKNALLTVLILWGVFSCETEVEPTKPAVFLTKNELTTILVDVQLLESHYHNRYQRPNVYANALDSATQIVFKKHSVTKEIFKANLTFYALNQDSLFSMYEGALDIVNDKINSNFED